MRLVWLHRALDDIEAVHSHIANDRPLAAGAVIQLIRRHVQQLKLHPPIGRTGRVENTRELVISGTPYVIPYRVRGERIEILAVIHGARRWPKRF
ncbi:MAG: type II toxin-antitoxin system RelE/ParE family toxin [Dongiaceae bacterium]